jgi:hypothetical protein
MRQIVNNPLWLIGRKSTFQLQNIQLEDPFLFSLGFNIFQSENDWKVETAGQSGDTITFNYTNKTCTLQSQFLPLIV